MKKIKTNPYRLLIQLVIMGLLVYMGVRFFVDKNYLPDYEAYCPFGGIQALSSFFVNNSLACSMTSVQIVMGVMLLLAIIVVSKLFCSYICPIGSISEWIGSLGEKLEMRYTVNGIADKLLRSLKYILLLVTFYFTISSSELFCKKFDPFYATVSGFNSDVSVIMGIIAISLVIVGSFYIRLLWCKYICPLGALSNIFRFSLIFVGITGLYFILYSAGIRIDFIWLVAVLCITGYTLELLSINNKVFPLLKITRNIDTCTSCQLCTKSCPQAIDVASQETVKHIDCNMCGDCINVCPEKDTLAINRKGKKWLPAIILVVLVAIGIVVGKTFEVPTIAEYWGDISTKEKMSIYEQSGLKNIKCFGSSSSFANNMRTINGVTGVATYVGTHTVKIWYNPSIIDSLGVKKAIFVPVKILIKEPAAENDSLVVYHLKIDNFFDPYDTYYLTELLKQDESIYGFITEFGCPVNVTIFLSTGSSLNSNSIENLVEQKQFEEKVSDNVTELVDLNYKVVLIEKDNRSIASFEFRELIK